MTMRSICIGRARCMKQPDTLRIDFAFVICDQMCVTLMMALTIAVESPVQTSYDVYYHMVGNL